MSGRSASTQTAFGPMVIAAVERYTPAAQRLIDDELAVRLLPRVCGKPAWTSRRRNISR